MENSDIKFKRISHGRYNLSEKDVKNPILMGFVKNFQGENLPIYEPEQKTMIDHMKEITKEITKPILYHQYVVIEYGKEIDETLYDSNDTWYQLMQHSIYAFSINHNCHTMQV